eukprot:g2284.t1
MKRKRAVLTTIKEYKRPVCPKCNCKLGLSEAKLVGWPEVLVFCKDCAVTIDRAVESENLHWFVSHIEPLFISSSSDTTLLPPSKKPYSKYRSGDPDHVDIDKATSFLESSDAILIVAGAGMSCDSGLPDFRGKKGFYRVGGTEIKMEDVNFHEAQEGTDILRTWGYIVSMMSAFRNASPHAGYTHLLNLIKDKDYFVFTSNIDGYFVQSGFDPKRVAECHGNLNLLQCSTMGEHCEHSVSDLRRESVQSLRKRARKMNISNVKGHKNHKKTWIDAILKNTCNATVWEYPMTATLPQLDPCEDLKIKSRLDIPRCKSCGALARPNVSHITDEDRHINRERHHKSHENLKRFLEMNKHRKMTIIEIGCGTSIHSLREESELLMKRRASDWTRLIRIDPSDSRVPCCSSDKHGCIPIPMKALEALTEFTSRTTRSKEGRRKMK